jgi:glycosyltransferase involved in cell wall biosynthesis
MAVNTYDFIFSSTIIPTINRSTLARSVESVLSQHMPSADFEVIVVNDSGHPLAAAEWQCSERVTILHTNRRDRCIARNAGAAIARGAYLHFLDDDDWMLPDGLRELWSVFQTGNASWIYGTSLLVDKDEKLLTEHHIGVCGNGFVQVMAGEWLPLGASLINTEHFFKAGGFDPRLTVCQDKDICRRILLRGELASTRAPVVYIMRDRERSTTAYDRANAFSVWSRDNVLNERGSFARMWASAKGSYWRGRLIRAYLTCIYWNLFHGKILNAVGRAMGALAGLLLSCADIISVDFWRALIRSHTRINVR